MKHLALLLILSSFVSPAPSFAAEQRPNVLFIAVDDLRTSLGCYGDTLVKSPNIDRFAATARRFEHAYTQQAVCGPSRTSLLTGRLPDNTRVWHNRNLFRDTQPDIVTLPQLFKNHGYHTISLGKIFSGDERELDPVSWSEPEILKQKGWKNSALGDSGSEGKGAAWEAADVPDEGYPDGKLARLAVEKLTSLQSGGKPFFLAVGFFKPHLPFNAPKRYWDLYDPATFDLKDAGQRVKGISEHAHHSHRELGGYRDMPKDEHLDAATTRTLRHGYHACVSYTDAHIGKLLAALDQLGLAQNTIVVLWGDHGWSLGEKDRWCKGTNFERDTRVPLMVRVPSMAKPGVPTRALVETVDIYLTLAALAGLMPPADLDGRSFVPVLQDPEARGRDAVLSQFNRPWKPDTFASMGYTLRTATQRYTRWVEWPSRKTITEEFYDYTSKQSATREGAMLIEQENVIADPAHAESLNQLRAKMGETLTTRIKTKAEESLVKDSPVTKKKKKNQ